MESFLVVLTVVIVLPLVVVAVMYNGHINRRNQVNYAFASIDVQLKKRWDLIPNLVNTVKAYAAHEKDLFNEITVTRQNTQNNEAQSEARFKGEGLLNQQLPKLMAVAEAYPDLKADKQFLNLQRNLTEIESQVSAARRAYNASVMNYNNGVDMFPSSIIAKLFNFKRRPHFESLASERSSPHVSL